MYGRFKQVLSRLSGNPEIMKHARARQAIEHARELEDSPAFDARRALLMGGTAVGTAALLSDQAKADTAFTNFAFPGTFSTASRNTPDRISDVLNVMEFGAKGDGVTNDTAAIRAAIAAMLNWTSVGGSNVKGCTLYFPPGTYLVSQIGGDATDAPCFNIAGTFPNCGRITGAGIGATVIRGFNAYNMVFDSGNGDGGNTIAEISNMTVSNSSVAIGSGCIRMSGNQSLFLLMNLDLSGMTCMDLGLFAGNAYNVTTTGSSGATYPNFGSVGIYLGGGNVIGWNTSSGGQAIGLLAAGNTGSAVLGCRCEEAVTGMQIGSHLGLATLCTIDGTSQVLTVTSASHQYPDVNSQSIAPIVPGNSNLLTTGMNPTQFISVTSQLTETNGDPPGGRGTYQLSGASGFTVSTPQPVTFYTLIGQDSMLVAGFETEGCNVGLFVENVVGCTFLDCNLTTNGLSEGATAYGSKTSTSLCGMLIYRASGTTIANCRTTSGTQYAAILFQANDFNPVFGPGLVIDNCTTGFSQTGTTNTSAFIDNGAGKTATTTGPLATQNVTNAVSGTGSNVRLSITSTNILAGDTVVVSGVGGTTEANGTWTVSAVPSGSTIEIPVTFVHSYTSGGTVAPQTLLFSSVPAGVVANTWVTNATTGQEIGAVIRATGTLVALTAFTNGTASNGNSIKFYCPSGTGGTVLTLPANSLTGQVGIGGLVTGSGIPTGSNTPYIDHGFTRGSGTAFPSGTFCPPPTSPAIDPPSAAGGLAPGQYALICPGGNLTITSTVISTQAGVAWGQYTIPPNNRNDVSHITGPQKSGLFFRNCDYVNNSILAMKFANLPDLSFGGTNVQYRISGMEYEISDCATPLLGAVASGSGSYTVTVKYNDANTNWVVSGSGYGTAPVVTFANLPATPVTGMRTFVTNSNTGTFGANITTTGAFAIPAVYNGTNWIVG
jgi:Pectate lyase superfamily protein